MKSLDQILTDTKRRANHSAKESSIRCLRLRLFAVMLLTVITGCAKPQPEPLQSETRKSTDAPSDETKSDSKVATSKSTATDSSSAEEVSDESKSSSEASADSGEPKSSGSAGTAKTSDGKRAGRSSQSSSANSSDIESDVSVTESELDDGARASDGVSSESKSSAPSETASPPSNSARKRKPVLDVESTLKAVSELRAKAKSSSKQAEFGKAFQQTTEAWEATRTHLKDDRIRKVAKELEAELNELAAKANNKSANRDHSSSVPLVDK